MIAELLKDDSKEHIAETTNSHYSEKPQPPVAKVEKKPTKSNTPIIVCVIIIMIITSVVLICKDQKGRNYDRSNDQPFPVTVEEDSWEEDSLAIVNRRTPDLVFFELHGPVKKMEEEDRWGSHTYEFDQDGNLIRIDGYNPFTIDVYSGEPDKYTRYERDYNGNISKLSGWGWFNEYVWTLGRPSEIKWFGEGQEGSIIREYNDQSGFVYTQVEDGYRTTYSHSNLDKYGNWRTREGERTTRRKIDYYPISKSY